MVLLRNPPVGPVRSMTLLLVEVATPESASGCAPTERSARPIPPAPRIVSDPPLIPPPKPAEQLGVARPPIRIELVLIVFVCPKKSLADGLPVVPLALKPT